MFKKNSICQLIKNVKDLIASASFKEKHCKEENALEWVQHLNNIRACAREVVNDEIIYA